LGWLEGTAAPNITVIALLIGLGHSLHAMSGFETLAQVYREIEAPKLENLKRTGLVVILYALVFTSSVSFFAVMLIPDAERSKYLNNLIGGLSMFLARPMAAKLVFHAFVVMVGTLILSGAVNTALIGSNSVLNRVAEDGVLPDWFRQPHPKYGTTSRIITLIALLQFFTILVSRGNVIMLGEAYAFGVIWSFALKGLAVVVLRYKRPSAQKWKVPFNFRIGGTEIPLGLILIVFVLFCLAVINVLTKKTATISGSIFTAAFFLVFWFSERHNRSKRRRAEDEEKFLLVEHPDLSLDEVHVRPGSVLVEVSDPDRVEHLERVLQEVNPEKQDVVVIVVHRLSPMSSAEYPLDVDQISSHREIEILSKVVHVAEKAGKHVELMVVTAKYPAYAVVLAAQKLQASRIAESQSPGVSPEEQARQLGRAWEQLPAPRPALSVEIIPGKSGAPSVFSLGPHAPQLWPADIDLGHRLWELTERHRFDSQLHHRDVVGAALRRFDQELHSSQTDQVLEDVRREVVSRKNSQPARIENRKETAGNSTPRGSGFH
jgi:hypothetical protein